eukprot:gene9659-20086_t
MSTGLKVNSVWSKAGFATCIHVQVPGLSGGILFDCGVVEESAVNAKYVFVTHGHIDHIGACIMHARGRAMSLSKATYFVPENCLQPLLDAKNAFERLDEHEIPMDIRPFRIGQIVSISKNYNVFAFPTRHRVASHGYGIVHTKKGLMSQYKDMSSSELGRLRKDGVQIEGVDERIELVYTGDTVLDALLSPDLDYIFKCDILIMELTYLDGEVSKAHKWGHVHLDEMLEVIGRFKNNQVILMHLSPRYSPPSRALSILTERIPAELYHRFSVALHSLGAEEQLTSLSTVGADRRATEIGWGWALKTYPREVHVPGTRGGRGTSYGRGRGWAIGRGRGRHQTQQQQQQQGSVVPSGRLARGRGRVRRGGGGDEDSHSHSHSQPPSQRDRDGDSSGDRIAMDGVQPITAKRPAPSLRPLPAARKAWSASSSSHTNTASVTSSSNNT